MTNKLSNAEINRRRVDVRPAARHPVTVLLEDVRSAYNVGAVFRTADAAYLESVYCTGITADPSHRKVVKTALGAQETVPWAKEHDTLAVVNRLKDRGYRCIALEITNNPASWSDIQAEHFPICLVVGNEISGVSDPVLKCCDLVLEIPQYGEKHSLNVAVAAGIAVYKLLECFRGAW
jgi:tRNA G18 (ribose-2'-O)-methylase SpoU